MQDDDTIPVHLPFLRVPVCACDTESEPPNRQKQMECRLRGGPCSPNHVYTQEETTLARPPTCRTCAYFKPLSPGHAAICFKRWEGLPWNAAVPLTTADETCGDHTQRQS